MAFHRSVTVDHTKCGSQNSTNFPVLVLGTYSYLATVANGGKVQSASGFDIVPYADSALTTKLAFERVSWSASTGALEMWVKVPTVSASADTVFYLGYGDATITTDQSSASTTWSGFARVLHLGESPGATAPQYVDSVSGSAYMTASYSGSGGTASQGTGKVGNCLTTQRSGEYNSAFLTSSAASNMGTGSATVSGWFYRTTETHTGDDNDGFLFGRPQGSYPYIYFLLEGSKSSAGVYMRVDTEGDTTSTSTTTLSAPAWSHIAGVYDSVAQTITIYINGVSVVGPSSVSHGFVDGGLQVGGSWSGSYDEVRASSVARSVSWVVAEYNNQNAPASFYTIGAETGGANSYTGSFSETFALTSSLARSVSPAAKSDAFTPADSLTRSIGRSFSVDVLVLADSVSRTAARRFSEVQPFSESRVNSLSRAATLDSFSLTDALTSVRARVLALLDALGLGETAARSTIRAMSDGLALSDTRAYSKSAFLLDGFAPTESATRTIGRTVADPFTMADSLATARTKVLALLDALGLSDASTRSITRSVADATTLTDMRTNAKATAVTDALIPTDSMTRAIARGLSEVLPLSDTRSQALARIVVDALTLSDVLAILRTKVLALLDAFFLGDSTTRSVSRGLADTQPFTEGRVNNLSRPILDSLSLADTFAILRTKLLALLDALVASDAIFRSTSRSFVDSQTLTDVRNQTVSRASLLDALLPGDSLVRQNRKALADSLGWTEALKRAVAKAWTDAAGLTDAIGKVYTNFVSGVVHKFLLKAATRLWPIVPAKRAWPAEPSIRKWTLTTEDIVITTNKDPNSTEDFQFDWTSELGATDTIATSSWTVPTGLSSVTASFTTKTTQVRLSGGATGRSYVVPNQVTLVSGQIKVRSLRITVDPQ